MRIKELRVSGIHCEACAHAIRTALTSLKGVERADVILGEGRVIIAYNPEKIDMERIIEAIETLGYRVAK